MCTLLDDPDDEKWELFLPAVQFSYNTAVRSVTNSSPYDPLRPLAALGGSDSDERISDLSVGRRHSPSAGGGRRGQEDGRGARGAPLPGDNSSAAAAPRGLRRGLSSGWPIADLSLPNRAIEYKKYRRRHVSSSSADSDVEDSEGGGGVTAVDLHPHGRLPAQRDAMVGGWRSPHEDPAGAALPGDGVPRHQGAAALGSCQDDREVAAGGVATRQQDFTRRLPDLLASVVQRPDGELQHHLLPRACRLDPC